jgi:thiamine biosynthesis lipoprotein
LLLAVMLISRSSPIRCLRGAAIVAAMALALTGCSREPWHLTGKTMGTTYSIKVVAPAEGTDPERLKAAIDDELERINALMSTYIPDSELSRFNRSRSIDWFEVDPSVVDVVEAAQRTSAISDGAFDATVGPLVELWGFGSSEARPSPPPQAQIDAALRNVGFDTVSTREDPPALRKLLPEIQLDLSALAKGYAVDRIDWILENGGHTRYMIEVGGEVKTRGLNARDEPWRIALERPVATERSVYAVLELSGEAIATSGDYRNFFEFDGRRYSHTLDPHTGWPVMHDLASVTVVDSSAMEADAMATALLVLGPDKGMRLANERRIAAFFMIRDGDRILTRHSQAFEPYLTNGSSR